MYYFLLHNNLNNNFKTGIVVPQPTVPVFSVSSASFCPAHCTKVWLVTPILRILIWEHYAHMNIYLSIRLSYPKDDKANDGVGRI